MDRLQLIQALINKKKFKTYLEIGVLGGQNFFQVKCSKKIAVDPQFKFNRNGRIGQGFKNLQNFWASFYEIASDDFFKIKADKVFSQRKLDIALVDGMHEFEFALNDVINSLRYLSDGGVIIMHDCNPLSKEAASSFQEWKDRNFKGHWNGDVWKVITYLKNTRADLDVFVADCDHGLGIITKAKELRSDLQYPSFDDINNLTYQEFDNNRISLINLKPESYLEQFLSK
jgi:hypothetical protein